MLTCLGGGLTMKDEAMNYPCDKCGKPATFHLTEITGGSQVEKHLCEQCAAAEGIAVKTNMPITQLLEEFILQAGGSEGEDLVCDVCGMPFSEFRQNGLLGCPHDYDAFSPRLEPLIARAQGGASQHVGKVPRNAGGSQKRHNELLRLRAELKGAVSCEDYERAAHLRDRIRSLETS